MHIAAACIRDLSLGGLVCDIFSVAFDSTCRGVLEAYKLNPCTSAHVTRVWAARLLVCILRNCWQCTKDTNTDEQAVQKLIDANVHFITPDSTMESIHITANDVDDLSTKEIDSESSVEMSTLVTTPSSGGSELSGFSDLSDISDLLGFSELSDGSECCSDLSSLAGNSGALWFEA